MKSLIFLLFGGLTLGAAWMTYSDAGVGAPKLDPSVRQGSMGVRRFHGK
ncbi:hypothetical protein D5125_17010 [Magnetovirga frankeli]|nr:hypothetical protein D5125_17010 [gamma proteobacterium SS-5]